jgi:GT2 family glycosyltransferase
VTTHRIHAVVVAYHGAAQLERCLASLGRSVAITVVDNSSSPEVRAAAEANEAVYIDAGRNLGFGAGVNVALRGLLVEEPSHVLLLNPDAALRAGALRTLADWLDLPGNERLAAVSPQLLGADGRAQRVLWPFPSPVRAWCEAIGLGRLPARHVFAAGAVLLLRWDALLEVGFFDERFFLYAEEADWQRRAAALGWRSAVCSEAVAEHSGAGTSSDGRLREALFHAGQETYVRKWHGRLGWSSYRVASCGGAVGRALVLAGERRAEAARRALLYLRGPRRCAVALRES